MPSHSLLYHVFMKRVVKDVDLIGRVSFVTSVCEVLFLLFHFLRYDDARKYRAVCALLEDIQLHLAKIVCTLLVLARQTAIRVLKVAYRRELKVILYSSSTLVVLPNIKTIYD